MGGAAFCGALSFGELAARFPEAGGGYVYLREAFGRRVAFLYGWKCLLVMDPGLTAALAVGFGAYARALVPDIPPKLAALGAILLVSLANALGIRLAARISYALALSKIGVLVLIVVWGLSSGAGNPANFLPLWARGAGAPPLLPSLAGAVLAAFFSFGGWWETSKLTGAVLDPQRTMFMYKPFDIEELVSEVNELALAR